MANHLSYPIISNASALQLTMDWPDTPEVPIDPLQQSSTKRKRRIFRPARGNNSSGAYGKFSCSECRRVHLKCDYTSQDQPCGYCTKRNLKCKKAWTERRMLRLQKQFQQHQVIASPHPPNSESVYHESFDRSFGCSEPIFADFSVPDLDANISDIHHLSEPGRDSAPAGFKVPETDNGATQFPDNIVNTSKRGIFLGYNISPISNCNYSPLELHYLRAARFQWSPQPFAVHGMVLKHMWDTYGFDLSHGSDAMRFAVMGFSVGLSSLHSHFLPTEFVEYLTLSHQNLVKDFNRDNINETHLFAIHFLTECYGIYRAIIGGPSGGYEMYCQKFCHALEYLVGRHTTETDAQYPLQHLWRYLLSRRRRLYGWGCDNPPYPDSDEQIYRMHSLDTALSLQPAGPRNTAMPSYYPKLGEDNTYLHYFWDVTDMLQSLKAGFRMCYSKQFGTSRRLEISHFEGLINSAVYRTDEFSRFEYLEQKYMEPVRVADSGTKAPWRAEDLFCTSYTHLSALLAFLRFVLRQRTFHYSQEHLDLIFALATDEDDTCNTLFLVPTLFCICIAFGSESAVGLKSFSVLASHRVKHIQYFRFPTICSCQYILAVIDFITSVWKLSLTREDYVDLLLANNWIWFPGGGSIINSSLKQFLDNNLGCPKSWGFSGSGQ